jgi:hypothetical protein
LGIENLNVVLSGKLNIKINSLPGLTFSLPKIPFGFNIDIKMDFDRAFPILDFPMDINKSWGVGPTNITINGDISSLWFNFINFLDKLLHFIPQNLSGYLPVISIKRLLEDMLGSNTIYIPGAPDIFYCFNKEIRTVPAGNFEAYNISLGGMGGYFYCPEVGHLVELNLGMFKMKLKSHTIDISNRIALAK